MLKDYSAVAKTAKVKKETILKQGLTWKIALFLLFSVVVIVVILLGLGEFRKLFSLRDNQRILLVHNHQPVAVLSFRVAENQLLISDLRTTEFDLKMENWESDELVATEASSNLIYSFILGTVLDQVDDYQFEDFSKTNLLNFFKAKRSHYLFLQNPDLLIREQRFSGSLPALRESDFACPIALINTTTESGLATTMAMVLQQSSFSIVKKDSTKDNLTQSKIVYDPQVPACKSVLAKLQKFLPGSFLEADETIEATHRSSVAVYIGQDLAKLHVFFVDLFHR